KRIVLSRPGAACRAGQGGCVVLVGGAVAGRRAVVGSGSQVRTHRAGSGAARRRFRAGVAAVLPTATVVPGGDLRVKLLDIGQLPGLVEQRLVGSVEPEERR